MKSNERPGEEQVDQLLEAVLKSSKYRNVCQNLIRNIGTHELLKRQDLRSAIKSTKNKLHQISGAYFLRKPNYVLWLEKLRNAKELESGGPFRRICTEIMSYHYSTRQRLNVLNQFYVRIFSFLPPIHSVIDLACGFHPLALPWMPLPRDMNYYAFDIYSDLTSFLNDFMVIADVEGCAESRDILQDTPKIKADLAFLLNALPCLEQVEKSASLSILEALNADFLVVSFPAHSLGGRKRDMRGHHRASFKRLTQGKEWDVQELEFEAELAFLIHKGH
jgi:16S rRNA (guanine(1405)-N(7))-methyltransferase